MRSLEPVDRRAALDTYVPDLFTGNVYTTRRDVERPVRFFRWLVGRSGSVRNVRQFAEATELAQDTIHAYLDELAEVRTSIQRSLDHRRTCEPWPCPLRQSRTIEA
jgi:lipopolysaccharide biosynthesis regulator YciM